MSVSSVAVVLLLLCGAQHAGAQQNNFHGTVITHEPKDTYANGTMTVVLRYKTTFTSCTDSDTWECFHGDCGSEILEVNTVQNNRGWCQREGIMTRLVPINDYFIMLLRGGNWINNRNNRVTWVANTMVNLRTRSDTGKANRSPQTTIIPSLRVPSNCARNFNLLDFDPDGDHIICFPHVVPNSILTATDCTLSFAATNSVNEGAYIVQMYMYDTPNQSITLTGARGSQTTYTTSDHLSFIPLQFVVNVDGAVPSCTEGQYLPRFLPPTPANRAQLYTPVGHTLEMTFNTEATNSTVSELLFSGPHNMILTGSAQGQFILRWTPSQSEDGEQHPVCFVAQTNSPAIYQSELRCVIIGVLPAATTTTPTTTQRITTPQHTTSTRAATTTTPTTTKIITTPQHTTSTRAATTTTLTTTHRITTNQHTTSTTATTTTTPTTTQIITTTQNTTLTTAATTTTPTTTQIITTTQHTTSTTAATTTTPTTTQRITTTTPTTTQRITTTQHTTSTRAATTTISTTTPQHTTSTTAAPTIPATTTPATGNLSGSLKAHVICNETAMTVEMDTSSFGGLAGHLRLNDPSNVACSLDRQHNSTHIIAVVPLSGCGTQIEEDDENLIFKNAITTVDDDSDIITRKHLLEVEVSCQYPKTGNVTLSYSVHRDNVTVQEKGFGTFTYQFEFFHSRRFTSMMDPRSYPLEYDVGDKIYMQIEASSSVNNTELFVESCRAAPYDNPSYTPAYSIIEHGCTVDHTVEVLSPHHEKHFQFSMEAFKFIGSHDQVYISCSVLLCEAGNPDTRCSKGCINSTQSRPNHRQKREAVIQTERHFISQGPLHLRRSSEITATSQNLNLNLNLVFVAGCLLTAVAMVCAVAIYKVQKTTRVKHELLPSTEG